DRLAAAIDRHRDGCPTLEAATLIDLVTLADSGAQTDGLEVWAAGLGVTVGRWTEGTMRRTRLIAALHQRLSPAATAAGGVPGAP
ncbi:MAG TPA: hypothetical protein VHF26_08285, partial [Trebonia sp.]|nr:hypothetical protein [Trebonia sp.]